MPSPADSIVLAGLQDAIADERKCFQWSCSSCLVCMLRSEVSDAKPNQRLERKVSKDHTHVNTAFYKHTHTPNDPALELLRSTL
jgi:hypothetical protein